MTCSRLDDSLLIRQGGLRFFWDRRHHIHVEDPNGTPVAWLYAGDPVSPKATLDQVHDAVDAYCEAR